MKKLLLILFVTIALNLNAQYLITHGNNVKSIENEGFYYYLPRNILRLDIEVEQKQEIKGRYSDFAKELLNTDNFIKNDKITYSIKNVTVNNSSEPDPDMYFFVSVDDKSKEVPSININLTNDGIIKSFGYNEIVENKHVNNETFSNEIDITNDDSEYYFIPFESDDEDADFDFDLDSIDENDADKKNAIKQLSDKEIAEMIINEIKKIRISYMDLISGYQEVNYGTTINYMAEKLKDLENEYLGMFVGKTIISSIRKTFYIIPKEGDNLITLSKFSDTEGFNSRSGESIKINFQNITSHSNPNKISKDAIENITYTNRLFYRNPAQVSVKISHGDNIIFDNKMIINQLGNVFLVPINKMKVKFDEKTGQVIMLEKE